MSYQGLSRPDGKATLNHQDAINADIISVITENFPKAVEQTKIFAQSFRGHNKRDTAKKIWQFLRDCIRYKKDSSENQLIKLPTRFINSKRGDCKSYSLTAASLLYNLGFKDVRFRYASYGRVKIPSHVYVVTSDENGNEIIVDGVYHKFNDEKPPSYKFDKQMKVYTLSGIEDDVAGIGRRRRGRGLSFLKKLALAPNRKAFRWLIAINIFGLAKKLKRLNDRNPAKLKRFWEKGLGGKYSELLKSVKRGYNHWAKRHHKQRMAGVLEPEITGIGTPALAAPLAAAAPIITAIISMLKKDGKDKPDPGEPSIDQINNRQQQQQEQVSGIGRRRRKGRFANRIKKIALAPHRRAFRTALSRNFLGLAVKANRILKRNPEELKHKWEQMGGKFPPLIKSIKSGLRFQLRRKKVSGIGAEKEQSNAIAGLITTVLKALGGLFKKNGEPKAGEKYSEGETTFSKILDVAETAADKFLQPKEAADQLIEEGKADKDAGTSDEPKGLQIKPLYIAAAAAAAFILIKKK